MSLHPAAVAETRRVLSFSGGDAFKNKTAGSQWDAER